MWPAKERRKNKMTPEQIAKIQEKDKMWLESMRGKSQTIPSVEDYESARKAAKDNEAQTRKQTLESCREMAKRANKMLNRF
jgi:hypothetical protein